MCAAKDPLFFVEEMRLPATVSGVWEALVFPERVLLYHLAPLSKIDLRPGGEIVYGAPDRPMIFGIIQEVETNKRLVHTFRFAPECQPDTRGDGETVVCYEIRNAGEAAILKVSHSGFVEKNQTYANIAGGWPYILNRLKTLFDSGRSGDCTA